MNKKFVIFLISTILLSSIGVFALKAGADTVIPNIEICVKKNGSVYVIGPSFKREECKPQDKLIVINPNGGPQGEIGPQGPKGDTGANGVQGLKGDQGIQGIQGVIGLTGSKGDKGEQGIQGIQGIPGTNGTNGTKGEPGAKGDKGDKGDQGIQGTSGANGTNGTIGADGATGPQGPSSLSGLVYIKSQQDNSSVDNITAICPTTNPIVIGGGFAGIDNREVKGSFPSATNAWKVILSGNDSSWTVYAICSK